MPEETHSGWPGRVAVAIVRSDPPEVLVASDEAVLSRLLALNLVSRARASEIGRMSVDAIRTALLEERWADAVVAWMHATGETVDAYPDEVVWTDADLDETSATLEIRLAPIFDDDDD